MKKLIVLMVLVLMAGCSHWEQLVDCPDPLMIFTDDPDIKEVYFPARKKCIIAIPSGWGCDEVSAPPHGSKYFMWRCQRTSGLIECDDDWSLKEPMTGRWDTGTFKPYEIIPRILLPDPGKELMIGTKEWIAIAKIWHDYYMEQARYHPNSIGIKWGATFEISDGVIAYETTGEEIMDALRAYRGKD